MLHLVLSCQDIFGVVYLTFHLVFDRLILLDDLHHEKTCLWGFQPSPTQTGLYSHRDGLRIEISDL